MIGSPAWRGATASLAGAGRACFGAALALSAVSAATAASVNRAGTRQRRIAPVNCAVGNRINMLCSADGNLLIYDSMGRRKDGSQSALQPQPQQHDGRGVLGGRDGRSEER